EDSRSIVNTEDDRFTHLVQVHSRLLFRIAYAMTRNLQDAEDVVQDTFLKLYKGAAWRRMSDEKAFLARSVWRVALDRMERRRRELQLQTLLRRLQDLKKLLSR
ncbi:MAG: sigma factor, partial [Bryobacteraceae bacterium]